MPQVLGFDISVEVEGNKLPEYQPEVMHEKTLGLPVITCWVPSEAGKEFCVVVAPPAAPRDVHWLFKLKLDGIDVKSGGDFLKKDNNAALRFAHERVSANAVRRFLFARIQLTDDESELHATSPDLGSITLLMRSVNEFVERAAKTNYSAAQVQRVVQEKAGKAFAHCIGFGEQVRSKPEGKRYTLKGMALQAMVVFKYRNLDILIADGIVPGRKQPAPSAKAAHQSKSPGTSRPSNQTPPVNPAAGPSRKAKAKESVVKMEIDEEVDRMDNEEKRLEVGHTIHEKKSWVGASRVKVEEPEEDEDDELLQQEKALKAELAELRAKREKEIEERLAEIAAAKRKRSSQASGSNSKKVKRQDQTDRKSVFLDLTIDSD
ncbi:hypothetical protein BKA70DRAFT_1558802 [Coprinopsis sp. MPI-PUGE-AT-0042]|nr:hypothetical protein BKA70DRAFT_1558802 [Coprinopsis sp. MPI-PUGE-AT-0042]